MTAVYIRRLFFHLRKRLEKKIVYILAAYGKHSSIRGSYRMTNGRRTYKGQMEIGFFKGKMVTLGYAASEFYNSFFNVYSFQQLLPDV